MSYYLYIAKRLRLSSDSNRKSAGLNVALYGVTLAVLIMNLSLATVMGFRDVITDKILNLEPQLKITNAQIGLDEDYGLVDVRDITATINSYPAIESQISSLSMVVEKPAILKTDNDFKSLIFRGVDKNYDFSYLKSSLVKGRLPKPQDSNSSQSEILISQKVANQLKIKLGDRIFTYFFDTKMKVRRVTIVGIYDTNFDKFDRSVIIGDVALLQSVNGWPEYYSSYVGAQLVSPEQMGSAAYSLNNALSQYTANHQTCTKLYTVADSRNTNQSFFVWLDMLDTNVIIILCLMFIVSAFTLTAGLLMIVLEKIRLIGTLKAIGATNVSVRKLVILLTGKLMVKAIIISNIISLIVIFVQDKWGLIKLNPEDYYMSAVPMHIQPIPYVALNIAIIVLSILVLVGPSYIITRIDPTKTMKFD